MPTTTPTPTLVTTASAASSLGDLLRAKILYDTSEAARKAQKQLDDENALRSKEGRTVQNFFENAKAQFSEDILAGRAITGIQAGGNQNLTVASLIGGWNAPVTEARHRFNAVWVAFEEWAKANGLNAAFQYGHDGVGRESWYTLSIAPV